MLEKQCEVDGEDKSGRPFRIGKEDEGARFSFNTHWLTWKLVNIVIYNVNELMNVYPLQLDRYSKPIVNHNKRKRICVSEKCLDNHPLKRMTSTMVRTQFYAVKLNVCIQFKYF